MLTLDFSITGNPAEFTVHTEDAGVAELGVDVLDDNGKKAKVDVKDNRDGTYSCVYYPKQPGKYTATIKFGGAHIPKSPYRVDVVQADPTKCRAYGPGLEKGQINKAADFKIETAGAGEAGLGLTIEGPSEARIECKDNGDSSCDVTYWPTDPGDYVINILYGDTHIPNSPFIAKVTCPYDPSKVIAEGPGLEPGLLSGDPADIDIDTRLAGDADLKVEVDDDMGRPVAVEMDEEEPGFYACTYYPEKPGMAAFIHSFTSAFIAL